MIIKPESLTAALAVFACAIHAADWPMAGANPARTSWTPDEVRGKLVPKWAKTIEPYISKKVQLVIVNGTIYLSTAAGLCALDARTGEDIWLYPTEMPLGHSPAIENGVAYVGCFDRKLHALDAATGKPLWTFEAGAGFHVNPLVINGRVYAGCRDSIFYCLDAASGALVWKYETGGPIQFSAAFREGIVFFAANDARAYALDAGTGALVWKTEPLPGHGFHS